MSDIQFRQALVSVSDKTGLVEFLAPLVKKGLKIISTGGTAQHLLQAGLPVTDIAEFTKFPEVMGGRVKTLHHCVHMALLARLGNTQDAELLQQYQIQEIDLVIVNLYPFERALQSGAKPEEQVEQIDIGGPTLLRGASKNHARVTVLCRPEDYSSCARGHSDLKLRRELAAKAFAHVSAYDAMIASYLGNGIGAAEFSLGGRLETELRYGENPHQTAAWYRRSGALTGLQEAEILQGKALSFNNLLDLDAAIKTVLEFAEPACVAVKHNNPCGVAIGGDGDEAVRRALAADPVSVFGGILATNGEISEAQARLLGDIFLECIVAPKISQGAREIFSKKKNLRVLEWAQMKEFRPEPQVRSLAGGFLVQQADQIESWSGAWQIKGAAPSDSIRADLSLAWRVAARLKSNAIAIVGLGQTLGLGMGQVNRVDAVEIAIGRWKKFHPGIQQAVLASDAFFPFPDSIELIHKAGIRWVIQPGGSLKDPEVLARAQDLGVNMVITGQRHFLH